MRLSRTLLAAAFTTAPALCQMIGGGCSGVGTERTGQINVSVIPVQPIAGAPYSAREVTESVRTLADGTHITSSGGRERLTWRDAAGRIRTEQEQPKGHRNCLDEFVSIQDPVAGVGYVLDLQGKRVYRVQLTVTPPITAADRAASMARSGRMPNARREDLGSRTENGLNLMGERVTRTIPPDPSGIRSSGTQITETWTAPQLGIPVQTKTSNVEQGTVSTMSLKDLSTAEPDPSLFKIPESYQVIDEPAGTVRFTIGIGNKTDVPPPVTANDRQQHTGSCTSSYSFGAQSQIMAVTGAPYSARESREEFEILADGSQRAVPFARDNEQFIWRDAAGRTRTEERQADKATNPCQANVVRIEDPVAGYLYEIDTFNHVVHRVAVKTWRMRTAGEIAANHDARPSGPEGGPARTTEAIGKQVMSGVTVVGTRETTTYPVGSRGNDRPMTSAAESWYAPGLALVISNTDTDATHKSVRQLKDLTTAEPDPALFQPPAGYKIVDETGAFKISISIAM
jgi:hypothetical protein